MRLPLTLLIVAVITVSAAHGQARDFLRTLGLTPDEIALAGKAAESLYADPAVRVGDAADWQSPNGAARGRIEVTRLSDDGRCVSFRHLVQPTGDGPEQPIDLRRCRNESGEWVLAP